MTTILRFEGLTALPLFGSLPNQNLMFLQQVHDYISAEKYITLDINYTTLSNQYFDSSSSDSILAIDINEKINELHGESPAQIIIWMLDNISRVELMSDQVADTASGVKRRTILLTINKMKDRA